MLRRTLLILALLLSATGAGAKSLVVRYPINTPSNNSNAYDQQYQDFAGLMQLRGATYSVVNASATRTLFVKTGVQTWGFNGSGGTGTTAFDAVFIIGYDKQVTRPTGLFVDSLTLRAGWPSVPVVFLVAPTTLAGKLQQETNACSTLVTSIASAWSARFESYSVVGGSVPYKWNRWKQIPYPAIAPATFTNRIYRPILSLQYSGATPRSQVNCADCDSVGPWTSPNIDTVLAYSLARSTAEPAPILVIDAGAGENGDVPTLAAAIAWADSASGGKVIDAPGASPIKVALVVHHAVGRGDYRYNGQNAYPTSGGVMVSTLNDSSNAIAGLDSLNKLAVPITFLADPCSLSTYPSSRNWIYHVNTARVGLEVNAGYFTPATTGSNAGAATTAYPVDPFGHRRTRYILPPNATGLPAVCSSDTFSTYCGLVNSLAILKTWFGDRVDPSVYGGGGDWSPVTHTRDTQGPGVDSVLWVVNRTGFKALLIEPITTVSNPGITWDIVNGFAWGGATGPAAAPSGYFPDAYNWPIFGTPRAASTNGPSKGGGVTGHIKLVATRGADVSTNKWQGDTHDIRGEFWHGLASSNWYFAPLPFYYHNFFTRTRVFSVNMSQFGGDGSATPGRYGWWQMKWLVNQAQFANSLGLPSKPMFQFVYLSEVDP